MSGNHQFFLLDSKDFLFKDENFSVDINDLYETKEYLDFSDELLMYMSDTLIWIPTYARNMKELKGLNFYGETIIYKSGAGKALEIFKTWANLFRCGTENFELTGNYSYKPGSGEMGHYIKLKVCRDEIVSKLEILALYCEEVIKNGNEKFIWHFGI